MINIVEDHASQYILDPVTGSEHRRQHAVMIQGVSDEMLFDMRNLLQFVAYRLDAGHEIYVENHLLAAVLRSVANTYYPYIEDFATYVTEEQEENGEVIIVPKIDLPLPQIDTRLLDLEDGFAVLRDSFEEPLLEGQVPHPVLLANSMDTLDFVFPERAVSSHGVKGLRIGKIDFLNWLLVGRVCHDAYRPLDEVLEDYKHLRAERRKAYENRMMDKYGPDVFEAPKVTAAPLAASDAQAILRELSELTN